MKTKQQYLQSMKKLNAEAYMRGKRVPDVTKNSFTRLALEGIGQIYGLSENKRFANLLTRKREDGSRISAYCSIHRTKEDLVNRVRAAR